MLMCDRELGAKLVLEPIEGSFSKKRDGREHNSGEPSDHEGGGGGFGEDGRAVVKCNRGQRPAIHSGADPKEVAARWARQEKIGKGAFGTVWRVVRESEGGPPTEERSQSENQGRYRAVSGLNLAEAG
jgi:hypothetical protein